MGIYISVDIDKAIRLKIEEDCREQLKKAATKYIKTSREQEHLEGMLMANELLSPLEYEKDFSASIINGGILIFEGDLETVLLKISGITRKNVDTPLKVLGKMAFIRIKRFEAELKARNYAYESYALNKAYVMQGGIEEMPVLNKRETWESAIKMLKQYPWGARSIKSETDFSKFLARDEVTDEVLQVGWDMFMTKELLES